MTPRVRDIMTEKVVSVAPDSDFKLIARLLEHHHVNLLPVIDEEHRVVGVVSEADLLTKVEWQGRHPTRIERWLLLEDEMRRAEATLASQMMTTDVATIEPDATVNVAAQQMMFRHVKALPVVDAGHRLVGIVSRADIVKSFVRDDASIARDVVRDVLRGALAIDPETVTVAVKDGKVTLTGTIESRSLREMLTGLVAAVPGVVSIENNLNYDLDDRHLRATREPADDLSYTGPPLR